MVGYAESDFESDASQIGLEDGNLSYGVFQQKLKWWPSANKGTYAQCWAFLTAFRRVTKSFSLVNDCWKVQQWFPSDRFDPASPETLNYTITHGGQRAAKIIVQTRKVP